jgi:hypothetical protein
VQWGIVLKGRELLTLLPFLARLFLLLLRVEI